MSSPGKETAFLGAQDLLGSLLWDDLLPKTEMRCSAPGSLDRAASGKCPPSSPRSSKGRLQSWKLSPKRTWTWSVSLCGIFLDLAQL